MKKSFITFACLLFVSTLYSQVTLEDVSKGKQFIKENTIKNKPNSSNWISLSSGFSPFRRNFYDYYWGVNWSTSNLISSLNYSHRHFLSSNSSLSYDGGIFFNYLKIGTGDTTWFNNLNFSQISLSLSGRILYNYHFNRFSINMGFGMSLISLQRHTENDWAYNGFLIGKRSHYFGIIGLNLKLNENNELGIRTNYQLFRDYYYYYHYDVERRFIFQLKFNHRL